jgi:membrane peptidoglycan carboxypeptidase
MTNLGLHQAGNGKPISYSERTGGSRGPSAITLGSDSTSPLTLASAYATVASGGTQCEPSPVLRITTSDRKTLRLPKSPCRRALDPDVANGVSKILKTVITSGTASSIGGLAGGRPAAGKTGTTDSSNETWFVGYTPQLSTAVWVGTPTDDKRKLRNLQLGNKFYSNQVFGATIAAPIWKRIMDRASAGMPFRDFGAPGDKVLRGDLVSVPHVTGMSVGNAQAALRSAGFKPVVGSGERSGIPQGLVADTQPSSRAIRGSTVVIMMSTGYPPQSQATAPRTKATPRRAPSSPRGGDQRSGNRGRG